MAYIDDRLHELYESNIRYDKLPFDADIKCHSCGTKLKTYYAENKLYAVKCCYCESISLVKADSPIDAAEMVGVH